MTPNNASTDQERLDLLLAAAHPCITIATVEEDYALNLLTNSAVERQCEAYVWSITRGISDAMLRGGEPMKGTESPAAALYHFTHNRTSAAKSMLVMLDVLGHLKDERSSRALREAVARAGEFGSSIILIDPTSEVPPAIAAVATRFEISLPGTAELEEIVRSTLRKCNDERPIQVNITKAGLANVVNNLRGLTRRQARQIICDSVADDRRFDLNDIGPILGRKRAAVGGAGLLDAVESPTTMDEIGGLAKLKEWVKRRQDAVSDEAAAFGISAPRGVLLLGVQGAGKSLAAKAIATGWHRPLLRLDVGSLYDRYIGESERRLREALQQAEQMAPMVLWIDEIEKGFASAASQSTDGGLSKRMFGSLLTWMQEHQAAVFLVATANDIQALPPELLRKGRFDEIFFVDLPGLEARRQILEIHLRRRKRDPKKFDLDGLADAASGFSGAEIEQAVVSALHDAFAAKQELTDSQILSTLKSSPPLSVTMAERIQALRNWSRGRCVPAD